MSAERSLTAFFCLARIFCPIYTMICVTTLDQEIAFRCIRQKKLLPKDIVSKISSVTLGLIVVIFLFVKIGFGSAKNHI